MRRPTACMIVGKCRKRSPERRRVCRNRRLRIVVVRRSRHALPRVTAHQHTVVKVRFGNRRAPTGQLRSCHARWPHQRAAYTVVAVRCPERPRGPTSVRRVIRQLPRPSRPLSFADVRHTASQTQTVFPDDCRRGDGLWHKGFCNSTNRAARPRIEWMAAVHIGAKPAIVRCMLTSVSLTPIRSRACARASIFHLPSSQRKSARTDQAGGLLSEDAAESERIRMPPCLRARSGYLGSRAARSCAPLAVDLGERRRTDMHTDGSLG
jgi:hypothetical protein